jgi:hypothetical protein
MNEAGRGRNNDAKLILDARVIRLSVGRVIKGRSVATNGGPVRLGRAPRRGYYSTVLRTVPNRRVESPRPCRPRMDSGKAVEFADNIAKLPGLLQRR